MRRFGIAFAISFGLSLASPARAEDEACVSAYDTSQRHRKAAQLVQAREQLLICAQSACPGPIAKECTVWLREVTEALPTVVFGARDAQGNDVTKVRVKDGDRVLTEHLDGREVAIDPGQHAFVFEFSDKHSVKRSVVIRQAEKNRLIEIVEQKPEAATPPVEKPPPPVTKSHGPPVLAIVLASVSVVALGSFAYFAIDAKSDVDGFDKCKPNCPQSDVDSAHRKALVADISLGVGVVSLGAAGWIWLSDSGNSASNSGANRMRIGSPGRPGLSISGRF